METNLAVDTGADNNPILEVTNGRDSDRVVRPVNMASFSAMTDLEIAEYINHLIDAYNVPRDTIARMVSKKEEDRTKFNHRLVNAHNNGFRIKSDTGKLMTIDQAKSWNEWLKANDHLCGYINIDNLTHLLANDGVVDNLNQMIPFNTIKGKDLIMSMIDGKLHYATAAKTIGCSPATIRAIAPEIACEMIGPDELHPVNLKDFHAMPLARRVAYLYGLFTLYNVNNERLAAMFRNNMYIKYSQKHTLNVITEEIAKYLPLSKKYAASVEHRKPMTEQELELWNKWLTDAGFQTGFEVTQFVAAPQTKKEDIKEAAPDPVPEPQTEEVEKDSAGLVHTIIPPKPGTRIVFGTETVIIPDKSRRPVEDQVLKGIELAEYRRTRINKAPAPPTATKLADKKEPDIYDELRGKTSKELPYVPLTFEEFDKTPQEDLADYLKWLATTFHAPTTLISRMLCGDDSKKSYLAGINASMYKAKIYTKMLYTSEITLAEAEKWNAWLKEYDHPTGYLDLDIVRRFEARDGTVDSPMQLIPYDDPRFGEIMDQFLRNIIDRKQAGALVGIGGNKIYTALYNYTCREVNLAELEPISGSEFYRMRAHEQIGYLYGLFKRFRVSIKYIGWMFTVDEYTGPMYQTSARTAPSRLEDRIGAHVAHCQMLNDAIKELPNEMGLVEITAWNTWLDDYKWPSGRIPTNWLPDSTPSVGVKPAVETKVEEPAVQPEPAAAQVEPEPEATKKTLVPFNPDKADSVGDYAETVKSALQVPDPDVQSAATEPEPVPVEETAEEETSTTQPTVNPDEYRYGDFGCAGPQYHIGNDVSGSMLITNPEAAKKVGSWVKAALKFTRKAVIVRVETVDLDMDEDEDDDDFFDKKSKRKKKKSGGYFNYNLK